MMSKELVAGIERQNLSGALEVTRNAHFLVMERGVSALLPAAWEISTSKAR